MVHQKCSSRKSCPVMDVSPQRHNLTASFNKIELSSSPRIGYKLELPTRPMGSSSGVSSPSNAWHYNNMVNNNRQQFNNLRFC